jgi:hypothetical protein
MAGLVNAQQHFAGLLARASTSSSSLTLLQAGKHERLCAAAAKLRLERRRSATPDYAGASMHSGARRVLLLDSLVCHGGHRMVMAPVGRSSGKRRWLRNCKVTRLEKLRGSTNNVCAADRRPACILEELHDTPCPGHAIVLVTCLYASQLCRP